MAIYAKNLTPRQLEMMKQYEGLSGFEPMYQDDFNAGKMTFREMFEGNVAWLEDVCIEVSQIAKESDYE